MNTISRTRVEWLDILKGIAIILVVLGHLPCVNGRSSAYNTLIYSFHMDLFFCISGYTASLSFAHNPSAKKFIWRRILTLLIPYLTWCIFRNFLFNAWDWNSAKNVFYSVWTGPGSLWFIPALFFIQMVFVTYMVLTGKNATKLRQFIVFILVTLVILAYHRLGCRLIVNCLPEQPHYLTGIFRYYFAFYLGVFIFTNNDLWKKVINSKWIITVCAFLFLLYAYRTQVIPFKIYGKILIGLCGVILVLKALAFYPSEDTSILSKNNHLILIRQLAYIGRHSLAVYLFSDFLLPRLPFIPDYAGCPEFVLGFGYSIIVCYLCIAFEHMVCLSPLMAFLFYGKLSKISNPSKTQVTIS